jgi:hypothetical protein
MIDDGLPSIKWLDKKSYVRIDPLTGLPQLIRIEPVVTEDGQVIPERVLLFIDSDMSVVGRGQAERLVDSMNCTPLETVQPKREVH